MPKDNWDKLDVAAKATIPMIVAASVYLWNDERTSANTESKMIEVAIGVLSENPKGGDLDPLREWAIDVMRSPKGPTRLSEEAAISLRSNPLPSINLTTNFPSIALLHDESPLNFCKEPTLVNYFNMEPGEVNFIGYSIKYSFSASIPPSCAMGFVKVDANNVAKVLPTTFDRFYDLQNMDQPSSFNGTVNIPHFSDEQFEIHLVAFDAIHLFDRIHGISSQIMNFESWARDYGVSKANCIIRPAKAQVECSVSDPN